MIAFYTNLVFIDWALFLFFVAKRNT